MTRDVTPDLKRIRLFLTEPHACSYLPDRMATTAFVDPDTPVDPALYSRITQMGFRRSGKYFYLPRCESCSNCISCRVLTGKFAPNRQQRRCRKLNSDLLVSQTATVDQQEHYPLYEKYIATRHSDGDMHPPSPQQYLDFIGNGCENTRFLELRLEHKLIGCAVFDVLSDGLSAIYTYYDTDHSDRGLGTLSILVQIEICQQLDLPYLYLGYWISNCQKMRYKTNFKPMELFINNRWRSASRA